MAVIPAGVALDVGVGLAIKARHRHIACFVRRLLAAVAALAATAFALAATAFTLAATAFALATLAALGPAIHPPSVSRLPLLLRLLLLPLGHLDA